MLGCDACLLAVGRMLLMSTSHHQRTLERASSGKLASTGAPNP